MQHDILTDGHEEVRRIQIKAPLYTIIYGVLYQNGFMKPWLKCVEEAKGKEAL